MEIKIINNQSKKLILFFAGWGLDWHPFSHLSSSEYDVAIFFNYTHFDLDHPFYKTLQKYSQINVIAYGAGVWAASSMFDRYFQFLSAKGKFSSLRFLKKINKSVAINGTLCPVSNTWGIPQRLFNSTLNALNKEVISNKYTIGTSKCIKKYLSRMCKNEEEYNRYLANPSQRGLEEIKNELLALKENYVFSNAIYWNKVIIGIDDISIPAKNQLRFWSEYELGIDRSSKISLNANNFCIQQIQEAHFPFFNWEKWEDILNF